MSEMKLIPGEFEAGERLVFEEFMELPVSAVVWGKSKSFAGPLQIQVADGNFRSLTDGDKIGIGIEFPNVAPESPVAAYTSVGQMEFFEAMPVYEEKS